MDMGCVPQKGGCHVCPRLPVGCPAHPWTRYPAPPQRTGIPIGPAAASYLFVSVPSVEALTNVLCGFAVSVEPRQVVVLLRDQHITTFGTTWHQGGLGIVATVKHPKYLQGMLATVVGEFITACREQNPRY